MFTTARAHATAPARANAGAAARRAAVTCGARATGRPRGSVRASASATTMRAGACAGVASRARASSSSSSSSRGLVRTVGASASPLAMPTYDGYDGPAKDKNEPIRVKIGDEWYDCRGWAKAHPGGERWLYFFDGRDATDVFYALHSYGPNGSDLAVKRLSKLPRCDPPVDKSKLPNERSYAVSMAFSELRDKLAEDGFFKREPLKEAWALFQVVALYASGTFLAYSHPIIATILLGLGMELSLIHI